MAICLARCDTEIFEVTGIYNEMGRSEDDFVCHHSTKECCQEDMTDDKCKAIPLTCYGGP
jgi:hypothetical protein